MCHDDDGRAFFRNNFKLEEEVDKEVGGRLCKGSETAETSLM